MASTTRCPADTYLANETYHHLRGQLIALVTDPSGHDREPEVTRFLGEDCGIWPVSVLYNSDAIQTDGSVIKSV